jgi:hypothetical protein
MNRPLARRSVWAGLAALAVGAAVSVVVATGAFGGTTTPPGTELSVRHVAFDRGSIVIEVENAQSAPATIAIVTVDDAIVNYRLDGPATLRSHQSATLTVPFDWVAGDPYSVGVTCSDGFEATTQVPGSEVP